MQKVGGRPSLYSSVVASGDSHRRVEADLLSHHVMVSGAGLEPDHAIDRIARHNLSIRKLTLANPVTPLASEQFFQRAIYAVENKRPHCLMQQGPKHNVRNVVRLIKV